MPSGYLMQRLAYRNFGDHEAMVVNHTVDNGDLAPAVHVAIRWYELRRQGAASETIGSTSTSQFLEVGMPVPSVSDPISRQVGGPYGTKIIPSGTRPSTQVKTTSACSVRIRTRPPSAMPAAFMSPEFIVTVLTVDWYSAESLPMLICWPCLVVRPAFMMKRCDSTLLHPRGMGDW